MEENFAKLNNNQRVIVYEVLQAVNQVQQGDSQKPRAYFIDGPGGSGKTMVYNTLISWFRCNNLKVAASAWTGIAATLLAGGRTCHNLFKLPVPIMDTSVCNIPPTSAHAEYLRSIDMFLIDEASMVSTHALTAINKMLQDITGVKEMFGGKIFVLGGDFRQVLPVVPRKPRSAIVEQCIKSSSLSQQFKTFRLTKNMRAQEDEDDFSQWLLAIGNGETLCHDKGVPSNCISIPEQCHIANDIVDDGFDDVSNPRNLTNTIILTPTNAFSLKINDQVLEKVNGEKRIYFSNDSTITENPEDAENFPPELLHSLTPSGMPPHRLILKQGAIAGP